MNSSITSSTLWFKPQDFQRPFWESTAPYLARIAPWGDGKTICMIMKGMLLSQLYPGNEGLIIRKRYNALERSTIHDFEQWTGLKVPAHTHKVEIPVEEGVSTINFAQAENLIEFKQGLQGMNLGWVGIEQGDDFESAEVFSMLIGRVRRVLTPCLAIQKALIELGLLEKPVKRLENIPCFESRLRDIEKAIQTQIQVEGFARAGVPLRQIMVIANTAGHNWMYKRWHSSRKPLPGYELSIGRPSENVKYIPKSVRDGWEQMKKTDPRKHGRYVMNSFEDYDIEGSYYAGLMSDALKEGRSEIDGLYDSTMRVSTFWDLGVGDDTVIWFAQFGDDEVHLIDYYANSGYGMDHYSKVLSEKPYIYADHYLPFDAGARLQGASITTRLDILRNLRRQENVHILERHSIAERIQTVRSLLNKCKFDNKCERGVECLNRYHRKLNEAKSDDESFFFLDRPEHDQYSHGADAFGYLAMAYRYGTIEGRKVCYQDMIYDLELDAGSRGVTSLLEVR